MRTAPRPIPEITPRVEAKLFANIDKRPDGIWAWTARSRVGDARLAARVLIGYEPFYVSRVMFVWKQRQTDPHYQIPHGMYVCHKNDVTAEVYDCNPDNLWLGTLKDNAVDRERKGRGNHEAKLGDKNYLRQHPEKVLRGDNHPARLRPWLMARGEKCGASKLNWEKVREIRALYSKGRLTQQELGDRFGVTCHTIKKVVNFNYWRDDPEKKQPDCAVSPAALLVKDQAVTTGNPSSG